VLHRSRKIQRGSVQSNRSHRVRRGRPAAGGVTSAEMSIRLAQSIADWRERTSSRPRCLRSAPGMSFPRGAARPGSTGAGSRSADPGCLKEDVHVSGRPSTYLWRVAPFAGVSARMMACDLVEAEPEARTPRSVLGERERPAFLTEETRSPPGCGRRRAVMTAASVCGGKGVDMPALRAVSEFDGHRRSGRSKLLCERRCRLKESASLGRSGQILASGGRRGLGRRGPAELIQVASRSPDAGHGCCGHDDPLDPSTN